MSRITGTIRGGENEAGVSSDGRLQTETISELISAERSRAGKYFGLGTGYLTTSGSMAITSGGVLWLRNNSTEENIHVQKLVFGWNGGSTSFNRVVRSFIAYNTGEPTANHTATTDQIENISLAGASPVASGKTTCYKWDGVGNGMTTSGGFLQVPNQIAQGNTSVPIDGEIILGPGDSMEMQVIDNGADQEAGVYNVAIVYYFAPINGGRASL